MESKKHKLYSSSSNSTYGINAFFKDKTSEKTETNKCTVPKLSSSLMSSVSDENISKKPKTYFKSTLEHEQTTKAEIIWALHVISSHIKSMSAGGQSIKMMKCMFPDSEIANNISLQRTKLTYIINYGLARYFRIELEDILSKYNLMFCYF